jgi:MFS superfamily sulfate permease-like transporter
VLSFFVLFLQPNGHDHGTEDNMKSMLAASMENIQVLALSKFVFFLKLKILEHTVGIIEYCGASWQS